MLLLGVTFGLRAVDVGDRAVVVAPVVKCLKRARSAPNIFEPLPSFPVPQKW